MADERVDLPTVLVDAVVQALLAHEAFDAQVPGPARRRWNCVCGEEGFEDGGRALNPRSVELVDRTRAAGRRHVATAVVSAVLDACDGWTEFGVRLIRTDAPATVDRWLIDRDEAAAEVAYHLAEQASATAHGRAWDVLPQLIRRLQLTGPVEIIPTEGESSNG